LHFHREASERTLAGHLLEREREREREKERKGEREKGRKRERERCKFLFFKRIKKQKIASHLVFFD
jgi:hypothetical protein